MRLPAAALILALAACGPTAQQKLLRGTLTSLNAARAGFATWDGQHQQELVEAATSYEGGQTSLYLYREQREPVLQGFVIAYELVALAFEETTAARVAAAVQAATHVYALIKAIMAPEPHARLEPERVACST